MNRIHLEIISLAIRYYGIGNLHFEEGMKVIEQHLDLSKPEDALNEIQQNIIIFGTKDIEDKYNAMCERSKQLAPKSISEEIDLGLCQ